MKSNTINSINTELESLYKKIFSEILPHSDYSSAAWFGSPDSIESYKCWHSNDLFFKGSPYEHEGNDFIHFTSLSNISKILNSGFLRMSEFRCLADSSEIKYAANVFLDNNEFINLNEIQLIKEKVFCLSMTEYNEKNILSPYLWDKYGDKGNGVCIRYKITEPNPYFYLIGKVKYGEKGLWPIKKIKEYMKNYKDEGKHIPQNILDLLIGLFSYHKSDDYSLEKEVRMFLDLNTDIGPNLEYETIYEDITDDKQIRRYNKLFLKNRHEISNNLIGNKHHSEKIFSVFPQIEIKEIVLRYSQEHKKTVKYTCFLNDLKKRHNHDFNIKLINKELAIEDLSDNFLKRMSRYEFYY